MEAISLLLYRFASKTELNLASYKYDAKVFLQLHKTFRTICIQTLVGAGAHLTHLLHKLALLFSHVLTIATRSHIIDGVSIHSNILHNLDNELLHFVWYFSDDEPSVKKRSVTSMPGSPRNSLSVESVSDDKSRRHSWTINSIDKIIKTWKDTTQSIENIGKSPKSNKKSSKLPQPSSPHLSFL